MNNNRSMFSSSPDLGIYNSDFIDQPKEEKKLHESLVLTSLVNDRAQNKEIGEDTKQELIALINDEFNNPTLNSLTREIYQLLIKNKTPQKEIAA